MAYLEEFRNQLQTRNYQKVLQLWEEYCLGESAEPQELTQILSLIKQSEFADQFSSFALQIIPQVLEFPTFEDQIYPLKAIYELQTQDSPALQDIALTFLHKHFGNTSLFNEKLRIIGLRSGGPSINALSNFHLLNHLQKNNFVFHPAGWGIGEILDVSFVLEQATIEFENLSGRTKDITFKNAFKGLVPIAKDHFLARRFAEPDQLEQEAKSHPESVIRLLLESLGPKTAQEIKEEIVDYLIPEEEYAKWWQQTRNKLKKDPFIDAPTSVKSAFSLRKDKATWQDRINQAFTRKLDFYTALATANTLVRDFPIVTKSKEAQQQLVEILQKSIDNDHRKSAMEIQLYLFMNNALHTEVEPSLLQTSFHNLETIEDVEEVLSHIELLALKKHFLNKIQEYRQDWPQLFQRLLLSEEPNQLKDYLLKEIQEHNVDDGILDVLHSLLHHPQKNPESFFWYFNKVIDKTAPYIPEHTTQFTFLESYLILLDYLESQPQFKELAKKMSTLLTKNRFALVRKLLKDSTMTFAKEFLLLISKCHSFTDHEQKIFYSLVEVVHPSLVKMGKQDKDEDAPMWTTSEGFQKTQDRIRHIDGVEMIDVAKEIGIARSHGDLRENAEFKAAQERRARLQSELRELSRLMQKARIITPEDVSTDEVGIATTVVLKSPSHASIEYTILGPWDADTDKNILSFQSKLAQSLIGKKINDTVLVKDEAFTITAITSFFDKK